MVVVEVIPSPAPLRPGTAQAAFIAQGLRTQDRACSSGLSGVMGSLSTGPELRLVIARLLVNMEQEGGGKSSALDPTPTGLCSSGLELK